MNRLSKALFSFFVTLAAFASMAQATITTSEVVSTNETVTLLNGDNAVNPAFLHTNWQTATDAFNGTGAEWVTNKPLVTTPQLGGVTLLFQNFTIEDCITYSQIDLAVDNTYSMWVNGHLVGIDLHEVNYTSATMDSYEITSYLNIGNNLLKILMGNSPLIGGTAQTNPTAAIWKITNTYDTEACNDCSETPGVPEPSTYAMMAAGLVGFYMVRRKQPDRS